MLFPEPKINELNFLALYLLSNNFISLFIKDGPVFSSLHRTEHLLTPHGGQVPALLELELLQMFHPADCPQLHLQRSFIEGVQCGRVSRPLQDVGHQLVVGGQTEGSHQSRK